MVWWWSNGDNVSELPQTHNIFIFLPYFVGSALEKKMKLLFDMSSLILNKIFTVIKTFNKTLVFMDLRKPNLKMIPTLSQI